MRVKFKKTTHFDITGLGGPYVDGVKGQEKKLDDEHALIMFKAGVLELLDEDQPEPSMDDIAEAISQLDPENDDHWTEAGLPAMAAVEDLVGTKDIKRADVGAAMPDWDRDKALEAATRPEDD